MEAAADAYREHVAADLEALWDCLDDLAEIELDPAMTAVLRSQVERLTERFAKAAERGSSRDSRPAVRPMSGVEWRRVFDQASVPMAVMDRQGRHLHVNRALCCLLGYEATALLQRSSLDITYRGDPALDSSAMEQVLAQGRVDQETRYVRADGRVLRVLLSGSVIREPCGRPHSFLVEVEDITPRRRSEVLWHEAFANAPIGMALLDAEGRWTAVNDALCELLGYSRAELLAMGHSDVTYPGDRQEVVAAYSDVPDGDRYAISLEKRYRHKDGHPITVLMRSSAVPGVRGEPVSYLCQYEAVGNGRMADAHLAHLALHDPLTGLANRALLADRLGHALGALAREDGVVAVVVADLDGLKEVNDQYGHAAGDRLLVAAAHELLQVVRSGDTVARLGGDEFVIVSFVADVPAAEVVRERIATCLDAEVVACGHRVGLHASVGLAFTRDPGASQGDLMHHADQDMYASKKRSRRGRETKAPREEG
jgi:diguanylate cyclase (GGDEF)-like protein/PAS domain S-box-containing protein